MIDEEAKKNVIWSIKQMTLADDAAGRDVFKGFVHDVEVEKKC